MRRRVFPAIGLLCAATPVLAQDDASGAPAAAISQLPPAEFDEALTVGGEEIEARKLRSRMTVDVHVNGKGPYKFVVDSGADTSVVGAGIAGRLALDPGTPALLHGITESTIVKRVLVEELRLGPTTSTMLELPVLEERDLGGEGMLGLDALTEQRLMLDFERRIITVDDGRTPEPVRDGVIVVTGRLQRGQLILTAVKAGKQRVDAVVDTGSEITIGNTLLRDRLLRKGIRGFEKITVYGVTGKALQLDFAVIPTLRLGSVTLTNVPIAFADIPPFEVFGIDRKPALLLGTDLMENFRRVSLDFHARKVRFQLRQCTNSRMMLRTGTSASRIRGTEPTACAR